MQIQGKDAPEQPFHERSPPQSSSIALNLALQIKEGQYTYERHRLRNSKAGRDKETKRAKARTDISTSIAGDALYLQTTSAPRTWSANRAVASPLT